MKRNKAFEYLLDAYVTCELQRRVVTAQLQVFETLANRQSTRIAELEAQLATHDPGPHSALSDAYAIASECECGHGVERHDDDWRCQVCDCDGFRLAVERLNEENDSAR